MATTMKMNKNIVLENEERFQSKMFLCVGNLACFT